MTSRSHARSIAVSVLAVVLTVGLAGCTGDSDDEGSGGSPTADPTTTVDAADSGMRATVVQQRTDVGTPRIGLEVTTDHHTTLHVTDVQLLSDAFEARSPTPKDTDFIPDRTIDLTVDYGTPVCEGDVTVDDAQVLVHYEQDGTSKTAVLPVAKTCWPTCTPAAARSSSSTLPPPSATARPSTARPSTATWFWWVTSC